MANFKRVVAHFSTYFIETMIFLFVVYMAQMVDLSAWFPQLMSSLPGKRLWIFPMVIIGQNGSWT